MPNLRLLVLALLALFDTILSDYIYFGCSIFLKIYTITSYNTRPNIKTLRNTFVSHYILSILFCNKHNSLQNYWLFALFYLQCIAVWLLNSCCPPSFEYVDESIQNRNL